MLDREQWSVLAEHHLAAVESLTAGHRARSATHRAHPVEDFLFTYYSFRPAQLRRWHPGAAVALLAAPERANWRFYRQSAVPSVPGAAVLVDTAAFWAARDTTVTFVRRLLANTAAAVPQFGCFGLHEWAMLYQQTDRRHDSWPLRLGTQGTDDVVRAQQIRCSHYDAFRFFTPAARPRNLLAPDLQSRDRMEQPGCLHAGMDLYKWAYRLSPVVGSELLLDCFRLARAIREVDMRASPYDLSELGHQPIAIETPTGRAEYVAAQRRFAEHGQLLRARLIQQIDTAFGAAAGLPTS